MQTKLNTSTFRIIHLKRNYGGGTQVLNQIANFFNINEIYLFDRNDSKFFIFKKIFYLMKNKKHCTYILSDPILSILLYFLKINFLRFVQGLDTIYFDNNYNKITINAYKFLYKLSFKQEIIYNSEFVKDWCSRNYFINKFLGKVSPGHSFQIKDTKKYYDFIYFYRKYHWKRTDIFLNFLSIMKPSSNILIINSDNLDCSFLKKIHSSVKIINHPNNDQINLFMSQSKYFISTTENEGFGMPSIEAMASKCIPIVPNIGGTNDFCIDKINSFKYELDNTSDFKRVLDEIDKLSDLDKYKILDSCMETSSMYSWKNTFKQFEYVFSKK